MKDNKIVVTNLSHLCSNDAAFACRSVFQIDSESTCRTFRENSRDQTAKMYVTTGYGVNFETSDMLTDYQNEIDGKAPLK